MTTTDCQLADLRATHRHLVQMHHDLTEKIILQWLRDNRSHPRAGAVDTLLTLYRLHGTVQDLRDADDFVTATTERTLP